MNTSRAEYEAWQERAAWTDLGHRATVLAQGPDAVRFLENFTTAAVGPLAVGAGAETFFRFPWVGDRVGGGAAGR